ncbi:carbohydrate ABC transporter permease [Microbacterium sp. zg.B185]
MMIAVVVIPFLLAIYISFTDLDQYTLRQWLEAPFVGLQNYVDAITQTALLRSIWITVSFSLITMVLTVPIGVLAALVTQNAYRGRAVIRSLFLVPYVLPLFVVASVWRTMLQPDGAVNSIIGLLGGDGVLWLNGPASYWALILVQTWNGWPFVYLLALAGLQAISIEEYEAATLDGATWSQKLRYVVLPQLKGPVALAALLGILNHINNFSLAYVLFGAPAPADVNVLPVLTYVTSFQSFRFGLSAAMAVISLILILIPLLIYLRVARLDVHDEGGRR